MDVIHTAIWISDLEETKAYYIDALGLEHTWDFVGPDGVTNFYVAGDSDAEIQFKYDADRDEPVEPAGIDHVAVSVEDVDAKAESLVAETPYDIVAGPKTVDAAGARVAFVEAPDEYVVELVQPLD